MNEIIFQGPILLREEQRLLYLVSFDNLKLKCETSIVLNKVWDFGNTVELGYNVIKGT
jgi:hypothetical protein